MLNSKCYAFKSEKGCEETLEDHLLGVLNCIEERWEFKGLVRKISRLVNIDENEIAWLIKLSAILHDIGKTRKEFQDECHRSFCEHFRCHYVISATFAAKLGEESNMFQSLSDKLHDLEWSDSSILDVGGLYIAVVVLPVLLHHYAGIDERSLQECKRTYSSTLDIDEMCKGDLLSVVNKLKQEVPGRFKELSGKLYDMIKSGRVELTILPQVEDFIKTYKYSFVDSIVEAVTGLLNICDGIVAKRNRTKGYGKTTE